MIQFNVMLRTGDERRKRENSMGIGKSSHSVATECPKEVKRTKVEGETVILTLLKTSTTSTNG